MSEKPIIFSSEMVRAILDGRKSQTRRVVKFNKPFTESRSWPYMKQLPDGTWMWVDAPIESFPPAYLQGGGKKCPYGQTGDRLWVRETWAGNNQRVAYKADMTSYGIAHDLDYVTGIYTPYKKMFPSPVLNVPKWKSPLFMPCWASRITLEITGVRVERLQEISDDDSEAEGFIYQGQTFDEPTPPEKFRAYWDSLNAKRGYGWDTNPWCWVISFKRLPSKETKSHD